MIFSTAVRRALFRPQQFSARVIGRYSTLFISSRKLCTNGLPQKSVGLDIPSDLITAIETKAVETKQLLDQLKKQAKSKISSVTIQTALGGMRGAQVLVCETSAVDPHTGLSYRGYPVSELVEKLPTYSPDKGALKGEANTYPISEALLWLLLTGEIPNPNQVEKLRQIIVSRMKLPEHAISAIRSLPSSTHPMTQLITGISACQTESVFAEMYANGAIYKSEYWRYALQDGLTLIAKLPALASCIYRRISVKPDLSFSVPTPDVNLDWAGNIAQMLGFPSEEMQSVMRLYMFLHADHEGGNVSAHAGHLVASALADPYLSFAASMAGLAAPLHGLANQQSLLFFKRMQEDLKAKKIELGHETMKNYINQEILGKGQVIPGFGHAVLRVTDPRFTLQNKFAKLTMPEDPLFKILSLCVDVVPSLLKATGKVQNPWPNVDAHSGIILNHFGLQEENFFTVLFGLSRCIGVVSQIVWDRLLNLPIERPKSATLKQLQLMIKKSSE